MWIKTILVEMRMHREINRGSFAAIFSVESIHGLILGFHEPLNLFVDDVHTKKKVERTETKAKVNSKDKCIGESLQ